VRCRIVGAAVSLQLDKTDHHLTIRSVGNQPAAQQQPGGWQDIYGETLAVESVHRHPIVTG
jgi:hypothetical protein